ncbi:unnamed protein product [Closterium sp. NIES-54]
MCVQPSSLLFSSSFLFLHTQDVTFDESVCFYKLHPHASHPVPLAPLFHVPVLVEPLPPRGPSPSLVEPLEISSDSSGRVEGDDPAADDTAATHRSPRLETPPGFPPRPSSPPLKPAAVDSGAETAGAEPGGAETKGEGSGGAATGGAATRVAGSGGADSRGAVTPSGGGAVGDPARGSPGGGGYGSGSTGATSPRGAAGAGGAGGTAGRAGGAASAGGTRGAAGAGGTRAASPGGPAGCGGAGAASTGGAGAAGVGGAGGAAGTGGAGAVGSGGTGAASPGGARTGGAGAARAGGAASAGGAGGTAGGTGGAEAAGHGGARTRGAGAARAGGAAGAGVAGGAVGATGTGGAGGTAGARGAGAARARGAAGAGGATEAAGAGGAGATGAGGARAASTTPRRPFFYPQPHSSLPPPDSTSLKPQLLHGSPLHAPAPHTKVTESLTEHHEPATRASTPVRARGVARPRPPSRVVLPEPSVSSLPHVPDPESNLARAASPTVTRLPTTIVTDLESTAAFSLVTELVDISARSRLDYVASLVTESESVCPLSVGGEPALAGVDFFPTFSPTPKMTTLWVLLHVAAQRDYELHSLNFSTAFLQGSLHDEIWLRRPPGFTGSFPMGTQTTLAALGFAPSSADPSLFLRTDTTLPPFCVLAYVDDLVFATADTEALALVKAELQERYTCTVLGELHSYLGLQITQDRVRRTITLTQSHMVHQVLQRFAFQFSSPQPTPLSTSHSLSAPPSDESVELTGPYP